LACGALAVLVLAGGACTFQPRIGMSFDDWNRECRSKTLSGGTLVERKGTTAVYYCDKRDVFYTFENGGLAAIKNQPAYGPGDSFRVGR
jgi:hypothetical protein